MFQLAHALADALAEFPDAFSSKQACLKTLLLECNKLSVLPNSIRYLTNLTELNVMANQLVELPEALSALVSLTELEVTRNKFSRLPKRIGNLVKLRKLNLDCNRYVVRRAVTAVVALSRPA